MLIIAVFLCLLKSYNCYLILVPENGTLGDSLGTKPVNSRPQPEDYFDWRDRQMVSAVKNQGHCAACWAFSAIASIESHLMIYMQQKEVLSEQYLIDCGGDTGCQNKGILQTFADIVAKLGGVLRDEDYPKYSEKQLKCRWSPKLGEFKDLLQLPNRLDSPRHQPRLIPVVGLRRVPPNEDVMAQFLYSFGPLSAGINSASMDKYHGGIDEPSERDCDPDRLDHAVLIVGYNVYVDPDSGKKTPYWIIKNSWGTRWGDKGFYYLVRGRNACGITRDVSFPYVN